MAASDWQRALVALAATVVGAALVAVLFWARSIFIPVTLAIFFAFVLSPVVNRLQRRGVGRPAAVILTVGLLGLTGLGIGTIIAQQITRVAETSAEKRESITQKLTSVKQWITGSGESKFGKLVDDVEDVFASAKPVSSTNAVVVEQASPSMAAQWSGILSPAAEILGQAAFTFILTVFMLLKREDLRNRMIRLLGAGKITTTTKAVDDASQRISKYLLSQLMVNTAFGAIITISLFALGVKYSILWGFIATLMRYVPYIGTWVGLIPPLLFSVATAPEWGGGWGQPVAVLVLFLGLEAFCNNLIEPKLYGQSMGLSEVAQLVSAAFWAFMWGPIGLILSGPLTVCLLVLGRHVKQFEFFEVLLGDQPALEPRVAFYQRLTAHDQDEAADVALEAAEGHGAEFALDSVVVPALCLARRDHHEGDLDKSDLHYVATAAREIAEEVAELRPVTEHPAESRVRLLIAPARDEAEHVAAEVFALTLDPSRWEVKIVGDETLASELITQVDEFRPAVVLIATLPPGGVTHARYVLTRLRQRFPEVKLLLGRWGADTAEQDNRSEAIKNIDGIDRTLADSRKRLADLSPTLETAGVNEQRPLVRRDLVGTAGA
ncbi:AI-2E family transporter [Gemmata sp. JC717]|uniref:AI-2E family transporter n=1 Tax=Gemmata algarum TaxID=2975278 RepID=UPI0021BAFE55|nr:AI-2E family transporter [Gemmata algarum]MDY3554585.1 AI-2E family transporter [Gemmata algarum]